MCGVFFQEICFRNALSSRRKYPFFLFLFVSLSTHTNTYTKLWWKHKISAIPHYPPISNSLIYFSHFSFYYCCSQSLLRILCCHDPCQEKENGEKILLFLSTHIMVVIVLGAAHMAGQISLFYFSHQEVTTMTAFKIRLTFGYIFHQTGSGQRWGLSGRTNTLQEVECINTPRWLSALNIFLNCHF